MNLVVLKGLDFLIKNTFDYQKHVETKKSSSPCVKFQIPSTKFQLLTF